MASGETSEESRRTSRIELLPSDPVKPGQGFENEAFDLSSLEAKPVGEKREAATDEDLTPPPVHPRRRTTRRRRVEAAPNAKPTRGWAESEEEVKRDVEMSTEDVTEITAVQLGCTASPSLSSRSAESKSSSTASKTSPPLAVLPPGACPDSPPHYISYVPVSAVPLRASSPSTELSRGCREALSSLLWEPYECQAETRASLSRSAYKPPTMKVEDVVAWYPPPRPATSPGLVPQKQFVPVSIVDAARYQFPRTRSKLATPPSYQEVGQLPAERSDQLRNLQFLSPSSRAELGNPHPEAPVVTDLHRSSDRTRCPPLEALASLQTAEPSSGHSSQCECNSCEGSLCDGCVGDSCGTSNHQQSVGMVNVAVDPGIVGGGLMVEATTTSGEDTPLVGAEETPVRVQDARGGSAISDGSRGANNDNTSVVASGVSVSCRSASLRVPVTIPCRSGSREGRDLPLLPNNNISNVQIVPGAQTDNEARTFTSTEAQTDDTGQPDAPRNNREHRRRERRERRHRRNNMHNNPAPPPPPPPVEMWQTQLEGTQTGDRLPDLLNSHLPPPYSTLPIPSDRRLVPPGPPPPPPTLVPLVAAPPPPPVPPPLPASGGSPPHGMRFPFPTPGSRRSRGSPRGQHYTPEEEPKSCCGVVVTQTVSIRWFIVMIAFVGICCAVVGTVLGAMKATGREHLTVSLLMIGVGIVLITVSGVAWRLTSHDAPSCRMMLGLGGADDGAEPNRRFVPRLPPSYGRPHHPYAAMMYPEFQYRPPPPSYQASMQEYRLRLLLLDRHPGSGSGPSPAHAVSPPPTYRSHAGSTLRPPLGLRREQDYSRPPSYRSRTSSTRPNLDPGGGGTGSSGQHSRDPSLSLSYLSHDSDTGQGVNPCDSGVNVISVVSSDPDHSPKIYPEEEKGKLVKAKDGNMVTIVQTTDSSQVFGQETVIVTVSGSTSGSSSQCQQRSPHEGEVEILAHL